jgi:glutaredoxin-like YruB-family protein
MSSIKIYSTSWCAYCKAEKTFLDEKGVKYEEFDVEVDQDAAEEMVKLSGQMGVPVTVIRHSEDSEPVVAVGFDQSWLEKELKL